MTLSRCALSLPLCRVYVLTNKQVLARARHLLGDEQETTRQLVLDVLAAGIPVLALVESRLLPFAAQLWPSFVCFRFLFSFLALSAVV